METRPTPDPTRLTTDELASLAGTTSAHVEQLADHDLIRRLDDGRFVPGDVHAVRLLEAFQSSGVPVEALVASARSGRVDFSGYHDLHRDPGPPSDRPYSSFRAAVDPAEVVGDLAGAPYTGHAIGAVDLQGIGRVELFRVERDAVA